MPQALGAVRKAAQDAVGQIQYSLFFRFSGIDDHGFFISILL
jgi:hypothetical protein